MFEVKEVRVKVGESELVLETGKMAKQANGSVTARMEGSIVLATATCSSSIREDLDFVPLSVEYNEKYYAAGKIPGGFLKREGRPKDKEILVCRLIDRPMRPLFSKSFKREIQVIPTVISTDQVNPPDVVAMCAASAAVTISDIPFDGPVGAVRVGYLNGEYIINPTFEQIAEGQLDILVAGTVEGITMVEGGGDEVEEEILLKAIEIAHETIIKICEAQNQLRELAGKEKLPLLDEPAPLEKEKEILDYARPKMKEACFVLGKFERSKAVKSVKTETLEKFRNDIPEDLDKQFSSLIEKLEQEIVRESILKDKQRTDGRGPEDIRPITCEIDVLPRTHGAALFTRGETQAMAVTTLGTVYDEQIMDDIEGDRRENFMLHYNFPPFCVGETGRMGTGRREIGHGHLAFRALAPMLPGKSAFPYTIRVVSEVLESNGSSSMATVCGGSLSLLNAGVPLKNPVAGIAMGLVTDGNDSVVISDILGEEDHLGDMDFKVAGTRKGITAFQMDIKVKRIQPAVMKQALEQAHSGRQHILDIMDKVIAVPRESLSEYAPRIITFKVDPEKIGLLIGPGGKTIKGINEKYSVETNIDNDGSVTIYCRESKSAEQAKAAFMGLLEEPEIGKQYDGVVRRIVDFGAFIEFLPGKEGLCHISKMSSDRINDVKDVLQLNQEVPVRIIEIDKMGRVNLSLIYEGSDMPSESSSNRGRDSRPPRATRRN